MKKRNQIRQFGLLSSTALLLVLAGCGNIYRTTEEVQSKQRTATPSPQAQATAKRQRQGLLSYLGAQLSTAGNAAPDPEWAQSNNSYYDNLDREQYNKINENAFHDVAANPHSTFSIDVDSASYSNVRRMIQAGQLPPADAVRIEELVNYFDYQYPQPQADLPFSITTETGACPWNAQHKLVHIGLQGKEIASEQLPPANLVFLIDVSGSMASRLPLVKSSLKLLTNELRAQDRVAIVVYAGAAGLVLPSTSGTDKAQILAALDELSAGGSTAGGAGIQLAYQTALDNFVKGGNNRVILATDGDFNVGLSSQSQLQDLIEAKREDGVFLTVLGFGRGNYRDALMETLADKGNGNYAYIDTVMEAKKTLVNEFGGTLLTIAKDVKIQVQFNPNKVASYRLVGYENRLLRTEDFNDDKKDAGELGAGHSVTAIYEIVPTQSAATHTTRYFTQHTTQQAASDELMYVKLRYKAPQAGQSQLISKTIIASDDNKPSETFQFSAAVAEYGLLLRDSPYKGSASYTQVLAAARSSRGKDRHGYRSQFINLVESTQVLSRAQ